MIGALYNTLLTLTKPFVYSKFFFDYWIKKKYRTSLSYRLGWKLPSFQSFDSAPIWIHAVSLGEAKSTYAICEQLKKTYPLIPIVFSTTTETAFGDLKKNNHFVDEIFYLPLDTKTNMRRLISKINPRLFITLESEAWLNLFSLLKQNHVPIVGLNAKLSKKSFQRFSRVKRFSHELFSKIDLSLAQDDFHAIRLKQLSVKSVQAIGNLKFDQKMTSFDKSYIEAFKDSLGILEQHKIICLGSTHHREEKLLLDALQPLLKSDNNIKILLVPRHPERFEEVERLLKDNAFHYVTFSNRQSHDRKEKIILIDTIGILDLCYEVSDISIVCGSFVPIGGHNLLEPIAKLSPTFFGPYIHEQASIASLAKKNNVAFQTEISTLIEDIKPYLNDFVTSQNYQEKALSFIKQTQGVTQRALSYLEKYLKS